MLAHRTLRGGAATAIRASAPRSTPTSHAVASTAASSSSFSSTTRAPSSRSSFDLPDPRNLMSYQHSWDYAPSKKWNPQLSKIVATIGPTSEQRPVLQEIVRSGMRVMRLNFSHATVEEVELRMANLRACKGRHSVFEKGTEFESETSTGESLVHKNVRAVLLDTRGPEVRMGKLAGDESGHKNVIIEAGSVVTLRTSEDYATSCTASDLFIDYPGLSKCLVPGMKVLLDDGAITLTVTSVETDTGSVTTVADNTGELRSRAGVNLPGATTDLPAMSDKDKVDIRYGMTKDVDYVAASFIQSPGGVREIRSYMEKCAKELEAEGLWKKDNPLPLLISKIESVSALRNFDEILEESDGIM
jgi:pyruvate kinase